MSSKGVKEGTAAGITHFILLGGDFVWPKFVMLGSTDSHIDLTIATESNFCGKVAMDRPNPHRANRSAIYSAAGYAAVWAAKTREVIFAVFKLW